MLEENGYEEIDRLHQELMKQDQEILDNMLNFAILELVEICKTHEVFLVDNGYVCKTYEQIYNCLKHWSEKKVSQK